MAVVLTLSLKRTNFVKFGSVIQNSVHFCQASYLLKITTAELLSTLVITIFLLLLSPLIM